MQINKYHGNYNKSRRNGSVQYIVAHYTGGTGSARNNCIYFSGGNRDSSADYFVDPDGSIWEYNDPASGYYTWAVGDGRGKYGITNANSCHIEVVNTGGPFTEAQIKSVTELVAMLRSKFGVPAERVVRHYDASRKQCPYYYVDATRWNQLHSRITGGSKPVRAKGWYKDSKGWWYELGDGTYKRSCWWNPSRGVWYYFDAKGYALTGWQKLGGRWYYFAKAGEAGAKECQMIADAWRKDSKGLQYWLSGDGSMATSRWVDRARYYVDAHGVWDKAR